MFQAYRAEALFAIRAVRTASRLCRFIQREMVAPAISKSDRSPVTVADFASQAVVAGMLRDTFPIDVLVAEEDSTFLRGEEGSGTLERVTRYVATVRPAIHAQSVCDLIDIGRGEPGERFWTLDPIDGTKGFLRGDQYVVALALIEDGRVVLGALGCPNLDASMRPSVGGEGSVAIAVRDQAAWSARMGSEKWGRLHVSARTDPAQARILRSFEAAHTDTSKIEHLAKLMGTGTTPVLMDSAAKYALLAAGHGEALFRLPTPAKPDYVENIWDQAAGSVLVEEAGGRVTDLAGAALDFGQGRRLVENVGVLATNGALHGAALRAVRILQGEVRGAT